VTSTELLTTTGVAILQSPSVAQGILATVAPGFSGSIPILADNLKHEIAHKACCFEIVPSSATDHDLLATLADVVKGAGTMHSVLHDDDAALERFLTYADRVLQIHPADIAIVSESQTAFGSGAFNVDDDNKSPVPFRDENQCGDQTANKAKSLRACTLRLSFPREIYRLRSAYPDQPRLAAGSTHSDSQPTSGLTLNLKTSAGREDDLPSFSREQLPMSQEAILLNVAETIHRRKIKLVGVAASDFPHLFHALLEQRTLADDFFKVEFGRDLTFQVPLLFLELFVELSKFSVGTCIVQGNRHGGAHLLH
jgi:hypothetical protein